ncbi:Orn/DAP/Arg decarboxylase 2 OS=Tsukamurella paurometabola (strain ATCC 8368 / DSM / CCUG 35730/ CIP 100753 / JCM 10117 / KCTC 9821 / NBRC 16120 / NCIMB 702349 / NCTC 13040) OX=521096 GN=Tpau_4290 PE=4 SV=1 [Tsukamurella paurometabola]|uniref:Orn/DAP/Arg decarboxylase 2 n=1 Tax=Tsukamurella paurometabola (strain ATCC 8368 / DSM 20162 / CCUG 35730 / CIP 100753 / JCM 10117 / KCTC 9821 / NBRC 16120 / NCIMB 702349 / NCTC 13040) TaxID=521096 RepID=D5UZ09_TSUPD|nr:Orn/DAP/Arg decarboxylase 2 [Tsukamurella paurometabola]ADG80856.1 Orn/DAP/Arg decarboxylase 2 [Tsukamurella paurometabola DSM 20162]SUQ39214.1 Diaminopimelate decarboxylase [Tsukamurella paurometabola]
MPENSVSANAQLRFRAHGEPAVPGRLVRWQVDLLRDWATLHQLIEEHGSPVNVINPAPLAGHAGELIAAAQEARVDLRVYFARKANKALALVEAALAAGHGIDVASEQELRQVLAFNPQPDRIILTAAVKPNALLKLAVNSGVVISIDNGDELAALVRVIAECKHREDVPVALRIAAELPGAAPSRFGMAQEQIREILNNFPGQLALSGFHFHLHGYSAEHRSEALAQALDLIATARHQQHRPTFIDIGGGIPMRYLDTPATWDAYQQSTKSSDLSAFWAAKAPENVYPMWQELVRGAWLASVLSAPGLAQRIADAGIRLHAEPGRCLLDGCGLTVARVEFRKQRSDGTWLIGLAMNRTQLRSAADDFILDPILIPAPERAPTPPISGFLVGAYCIEAELITRRRITFPEGVAVGDLIAFTNTAGYLMHILESASHQIPLAHNIVLKEGRWRRDQIDQP